jgi:hypothetical protein
LGTVSTGTTVGAGNDFAPSCRPASLAPDLTFAWRAPTAGAYVFDTNGSAFDTVLYVKTSCRGPELPGACDDDGGSGLQSRVVVSLAAGQGVVVVVDGFSSSMGAYQLNIGRLTRSEAGFCADMLDNDLDGAIDCMDPDCFGDMSCSP